MTRKLKIFAHKKILSMFYLQQLCFVATNVVNISQKKMFVL